MKGLALMETRVLTDLVAPQLRLVAGMEQCAERFIAWYGESLTSFAADSEIWILVGSEQGYCGDFNETLLARQSELLATSATPAVRLFVGRRLARRVDNDGDGTQQKLPGASVSHEVPGTLLRLTRELNRLLSGGVTRGASVSVLYHCAASAGIRLRRLLPFAELPHESPRAAFPPLLNLSADAFLAGLTAHYLYAVLNEVLYSSLLVESRRRLAHMDGALKRIDEDSRRLQLAYNAQRQQDIIEEIELIMLSADDHV